MTELFSSSDFQLIPHNDSVFREEIFLSLLDAQRAGLKASDQYCIFGIEPLQPGPKEDEFAARVIVTSTVAPGTIQINQHFLAETGFLPNDNRFWFVRSAPAKVIIQHVVIEHALDQGFVDREVKDLRNNRQELFEHRCMLVGPGQGIKDLTLRMINRASFYFRDIRPFPTNLRDNMILVFDNVTQINLFIPHRKSGVDMVVVVDGSGSMNFEDFLYSGKPRSRLEGVKIALDMLFQAKLVSGSRVSSIAAIVFAKNVRMLYPSSEEMKKILGPGQLASIKDSIKRVNKDGLENLGVDRNGTVISMGLKTASDLLDYFAQENNEKMIILLSDGADWQEENQDTNGRNSTH
jgi:hypothetical protein